MNEPSKPSDPPRPWRLVVEGMDCAGCERKVESAVARVAGVEAVSASATLGTLTVTPSSGGMNPDAVEAAVRALGYGVAASAEAAGGSRWWQTAKGRLVLATGALLAVAFVLHLAWPVLGDWPFVVATLVGLVPIAQAAWGAMRQGRPFTIETLMVLAAGGALGIDAAAESAVVVFLFAVGELLEGVAASRARRSISALSDLTPATARRLEGGEVREVPAASLVPGQRVRVRPGDRVPCDGTILEGYSWLDESSISGESEPREKGPGDALYAGTVNLDGGLEVEVSRRAEDNTIARIIRLVEDAQASRAPVARFIDRFARIYMPVVVALALLVAVLPPLVLGLAWSESIYRALAMLLIACPCALVISTPAAIAAGLSSGARRGLLVKGGAVLESLGRLRTVALDKTGTLTAGTPRVTDVEAWASGLDAHEVLRLAAALERESSHPIAVAIVEHAQALGIVIADGGAIRALPGRGVAGRIEGRELRLVGPRQIEAPMGGDAVRRGRLEALEAQGKSLAILAEGDRPLGMLAVRDEPREDAREGLAALRRLGVVPIMLSGDNARTAGAIAASLGIEVHAELMPQDKARLVSEWRAGGRGPVGKVGDGINDAPALAAADVGIAMGGGTDVALETADAALLRNRVTGIAELIALSRATLRTVRINVALALGLKGLFLATTALGITGLWIAVMADTGATVLVTLNALRLLGHRF